MNDFYGFLRSYSALLSVAFGGALLTLVSQFSGIAPPFPGLLQITATYQLLILIVVYQIFYRKRRVDANRAIVRSFSLFAAATVVYLISLYSLTFRDSDGMREFKGLACTKMAAARFGDECPILNQRSIESAGNIASDLWTDTGVAFASVIVLILWLVFFTAACFAIAVFVNFNRRSTS